MASEIRVNKIINRSGLSTVTFSDTGAIVSGIVTANSFSGNVTGAVTGSGANLTSIPAGQLTGTVADARLTTVSSSKLSGALPAIDGSSLTGINTAFGSGTSVNTSGIITATAFVPTVGQLSHRNLIINGAMNVAQRGTSSTSNGFHTLDRFTTSVGGTDEALTQAQVDLSSSDTPYSSGFRKAFKLTNGNQTSGAGAGDYGMITYSIEAQDIANSGWNYTDANSKLTIQFWAKSSVAKTFILSLYTQDGTDYGYNHKYALAANTWTKITHTFPGNSNLTFDNNNGLGIQFQWIMFTGTTYTSGSTVDQWVVYNGNTSTPDDTSDWWTTNDATFELTGVQLEVGSVTTPFEHRSFTEELLRCQRYFYKIRANAASYLPTTDGGRSRLFVLFPVLMRVAPSGSMSNYTLSTTEDGVTGYQSSNATDVLYEGTFNAEL